MKKLPLSLALFSLLALVLGGTTSAQPRTLASLASTVAENPSVFSPASFVLADSIVPTVSAIDPASAANDIGTHVTITGANFTAVMDGTGTAVVTSPTASLGSKALTGVTWVSSTTLTATVPWGLDPGAYTLTVVNPDGGPATLASAFTVTQGIGQWNGGNLFGGEVRQILMKPDDPNTLYAPAYGITGLFRSEDAGEHWTHTSADIHINNGYFAIDPLHPDRLYGFDYNGLHRSEDEGETWTTLMPNTWPDGRAIENQAQVYVSPHDPQALFVSSSVGPGGTYSGGVLGLIKSTNEGASWNIVTDMEGIGVEDVAFDPADASKMVLATSDARVFQSIDGGNTWSEVAKPSLTSMGFGSITYNPYRPTEVWIASQSSGGIYKSTGVDLTSWGHVAWAGVPGNTFVTFTGADSVYISGKHSGDGGLTWQQFGPVTSFGEIVFDPDNHQIGYVGENTYGVQKTIDGGQTWEAKNQGLAGMTCNSLDVSSADPLRVYAALGGSPGIYRSNDGANNWTYVPIPSANGVRVIREDPFDPQRLYVAADSLDVSTDGGESWSDLGWNLPPSSPAGMRWAMEPDPFQAGHLLLGMVSGSYGIGTGLLYSSSDHGVSWQAVTMPQNLAWTTDIAFDPVTPGLVYLATSGTGIYRSTNGGTSWRRIDDQQQPDLQSTSSIAISTYPQHILFVGGNLPCRSLDGGDTWECEHGSPGGVTRYMFADGDSTRLYAATGTGLFFSSDAGDSWEPAAGTIGRLQILGLGYADADGHTILYAATSGGAVGMTSSMAAATPLKALTTTSGLVDAGIYRYALLPAPTVTSFTPTAGPVGTSVTLTGTGFTGATKVTFHGTAATSFSVTSATKITTTVPSGASTGTIAVTTAGGTGTSATSFTVSIPPRTLGVIRAGSGTGTVTSVPAGINCGPTCSHDFANGSSVSLSASALAGSVFAGWSGACSGTGSCTLTMSGDRAVTATFTITTHNLTVSKSGAGTGTVISSPAGINCGSTCVHAFNFGTHVVLAATPATGSRFGGWSGGSCSGTGSCPLTVNADTTATAVFNLIPSPPRTTKKPPQTKITKAKINSKKRMATFGFRGSGGVKPYKFQCKLDKKKYSSCRSGKTYKHLKPGKHTFRVRAKDHAGRLDKTPAIKKVKIKH